MYNTRHCKIQGMSQRDHPNLRAQGSGLLNFVPSETGRLGNLSTPEKGTILKGTVTVQASTFRGYVSFQGGHHKVKSME